MVTHTHTHSFSYPTADFVCVCVSVRPLVRMQSSHRKPDISVNTFVKIYYIISHLHNSSYLLLVVVVVLLSQEDNKDGEDDGAPHPPLSRSAVVSQVI